MIDWWTLDGSVSISMHTLSIKTYDPSATYHLKVMLSPNMIALLLTIQIFSTPFLIFTQFNKKNTDVKIHDISIHSKFLRRNTDEGQLQYLDAGVINSNYYWLSILLKYSETILIWGFWFFLESRVPSRGKLWGPKIYDRWWFFRKWIWRH